jgi:hypothetical protein
VGSAHAIHTYPPIPLCTFFFFKLLLFLIPGQRYHCFCCTTCLFFFQIPTYVAFPPRSSSIYDLSLPTRRSNRVLTLTCPNEQGHVDVHFMHNGTIIYLLFMKQTSTCNAICTGSIMSFASPLRFASCTLGALLSSFGTFFLTFRPRMMGHYRNNLDGIVSVILGL